MGGLPSQKFRRGKRRKLTNLLSAYIIAGMDMDREPDTRDMAAENAEILRLKFEDGERSGRGEASLIVAIQAPEIANLVSNQEESKAVFDALANLSAKIRNSQ
jgi:hypothetical protein